MAAETRSSAPAAFGRYELGARVASGGMATVYLARSRGPEGFARLAAIKLIHEHLTEQRQFVEMFLDEARIASRIQHPNVCQVFDFGESPYGFYIAMEYLEGEPLSAFAARLASSPLAASDDRPLVAARVLERAAAGLHAAHEALGLDGQPLGVVHRDVSPQNVFLTYGGSVKVIDFGIASAIDRVHRTHTGGVKGKFAYMAPEQASAQRVDRRADVWSLGVVLWELLTGERLFARESPVQTVMALATEPIVRPSERGAPPAFDDVVMRALSRDVEQRYPTARAFAQDVRNAARSLGEPADEGTLEAWMEALFPDGRAVARDRASRSVWGAAPAPAAVDPGEISHVARAAQAADTTPELAAPPDPAPAPRPADDPTVVTSTRRSWPLYLGVGSVVGALGVLAVALFLGSSVEGLKSAPRRDSAGAIRGAAPQLEEAQATPSSEPDALPPSPVIGPSTAEPTPESASGSEPGSESAQAPPRPTRRRARGRRASRGAERPAPPAREGTVVISMRSGFAYVYDARGRFLGETPLVLRRPAGPLRLSLRPNGQPPPRPIRVEVVAGQRTARSF